MSYSNKFDQKERRAQLAHDKAVADTNSLAGRRVLDDLLESQGRFAKSVQTTPLVEYPKAADWSNSPVPNTEPPVGYDLNYVEPCGSHAEIAASIAKRDAANANAAANTQGDAVADPSSVLPHEDVDRDASPDPIPRRPVHFEE